MGSHHESAPDGLPVVPTPGNYLADDPGVIDQVRFTADDQTPLDIFADLPKTVQFGRGKFPSPDQYYDAVDTLKDTTDTPQSRLVALAQRDWHIRGQNGCQFARLVAVEADTMGWNYTVVETPGAEVDPESARQVGAAVGEVTNDPDVEVNSLLFPEVRDAKGAVAAIGALIDNGDFWLERNEVADGLLRLNLRYPINDEQVQAWIMAFGPFDFLPNTRQAPYFELAIRVKPKPPKIFHRLNQDGSAAHLADVPLQMADAYWETRFDSTLRRTRHILGGEPDDVSAAKATLAVPVELLQ